MYFSTVIEETTKHDICFVLIKLVLIKSCYLRLCIRILLRFGKSPHSNRHVNEKIFEKGLRSLG